MRQTVCGWWHHTKALPHLSQTCSLKQSSSCAYRTFKLCHFFFNCSHFCWFELVSCHWQACGIFPEACVSKDIFQKGKYFWGFGLRWHRYNSRMRSGWVGCYSLFHWSCSLAPTRIISYGQKHSLLVFFYVYLWHESIQWNLKTVPLCALSLTFS